MARSVAKHQSCTRVNVLRSRNRVARHKLGDLAVDLRDKVCSGMEGFRKGVGNDYA